MSEFISIPNVYLEQKQRTHNARIIYRLLREQGWTPSSIFGILGNMDVESTLNPELWQGRQTPANIYTTNKGYGLNQWTPANKLITWADGEGLSYFQGEAQIKRMIYEYANNLQWSTDNILNYTWIQYVNSNEPISTLTRVFMWAYLRPGNPNLELRQQRSLFYARYMYNFPKWAIPVIIRAGENERRWKYGI